MKKSRLMSFSLMVFMTIVGLILFIILSGGFTKTAIYLTVLVGLFLILGITTFVQNRKDVVDRDELSEKIIRTAAARSFMISFYPWIMLMIFNNLFEDSITQISVGIGIMAVIFLANYLIVRFLGLKE